MIRKTQDKLSKYEQNMWEKCIGHKTSTHPTVLTSGNVVIDAGQVEML